MKIYLYFFLFLFLNCQSQVGKNDLLPQSKLIHFEDKYHYPYTLTQNDFLIINSQKKMDEVFSLIHQRNTGNRYSPIPAVMEDETYVLIKPKLKNTNDVLIEEISLNKNILYLKVKEFDNPDFEKLNRKAPTIFLKLSGNISFKKVVTKY